MIVFLSTFECDELQKHQRQLDPTEIIAIPYDLSRLAIYVALTIALTILWGDSTQRHHKLFQLFPLTLCCFVLFILCGASPYENLFHTLLAAAYFAAVCWFDPPFFHKKVGVDKSATDQSFESQLSSWIRTYKLRLQGIGRQPRPSTDEEMRQVVLAQIILYSCIACTVPMQILLLYDRGWQVQRWPIPVVLGSSLGWIVGLLVGTVAASSCRAKAAQLQPSLSQKD
jgi:hypothetical protein